MLKRSICATFCLFMAVACGGGSNESQSPPGETSGNGTMSQGSGATPGNSPSSSEDPTAEPSTSSGGSQGEPANPASGGTEAMGGSGTEPTNVGGQDTMQGDAGEEATTGGENTGVGGQEAMGGDTSEGGMGGETNVGGEEAMGGDTGEGGMGGSGEVTGDCRVWMAPDGNDSNDGSESSPVATLHAAYDLMCPKPPDGTENGAECSGAAPRTICAKAGTYQETERLEFKKTRMGTADSRLTLQGDPNSSERPVFDFSGQERLECGANPDNIGGITINAWYVTVKDIVVRGANDNCILVQGYEGLVEHVLVYECADSGIQISSGGEYDNSGINNTILNCDSRNNWDPQCDGENADGFAVKKGTGAGNAFIGCRAWDNIDDGYDLFAWTSTVRIENCWAFNQCGSNRDTGSDCNGFKLGGDDVSATHDLSDMIAVGNPADGFTNNNNPASLSCSGTCAAWDNGGDQSSVSGVSTSPIGGANVSNMAADSARNADGSLKSISSL